MASSDQLREYARQLYGEHADSQLVLDHHSHNCPHHYSREMMLSPLDQWNASPSPYDEHYNVGRTHSRSGGGIPPELLAAYAGYRHGGYEHGDQSYHGSGYGHDDDDVDVDVDERDYYHHRTGANSNHLQRKFQKACASAAFTGDTRASRELAEAHMRARRDKAFQRQVKRSRTAQILGTGGGALLGAAICSPFLPAVPWCAAAGAGIGAGIADAVSPHPGEPFNVGSLSRKVALGAAFGGLGAALVPAAPVLAPAIGGGLAGWLNSYP